MSFEKEFPGLDGLIGDVYDGNWYLSPTAEEGCLVHVDVIEKYCLDKQRVKEDVNTTIDDCYKELSDLGYTHEDSVPSPDMIKDALFKKWSIAK